MKFFTLTLLVIFNISTVFAQEINEEKYRFAKKVFESNEYIKKDYPIFQKGIKKITATTFEFGDKFVNISKDNLLYVPLFEKGIFNLDVIFGEVTYKKAKASIDSLSVNQKHINNLVRNDTIIICCIEALEKLNPNPQTKRFLFWHFRIGISNPTEYYIEFTNEKATKDTFFNEFLENAKMTFFYKGTIII